MILYVAHYGLAKGDAQGKISSISEITVTDYNSRYGWPDGISDGAIPLDGTTVQLYWDEIKAAVDAQLGHDDYTSLSCVPTDRYSNYDYLLTYVPSIMKWAPGLYNAFQSLSASGYPHIILPQLNRVIGRVDDLLRGGIIYAIEDDGDTLTPLNALNASLGPSPCFNRAGQNVQTWGVYSADPADLLDPDNWWELYFGANTTQHSPGYQRNAYIHGITDSTLRGYPALLFGGYVPPCKGYRYLIGDGSGKVYAAISGTLVEMLDGLAAETFREYGMLYVPTSGELIPLDKPRVYGWIEEGDAPELSATVDAYPEPQCVETSIDLTDAAGVDGMSASYTGAITVETSRSGEGWTSPVPMAEFLSAPMTEGGTLHIRFWLHGGATLTSFSLTYLSTRAAGA